MDRFEQLAIPTGDGDAVHMRLFRPSGAAKGAPRAGVLIVPAMGVTQTFYAAFAEWLAGQGFLVATFDYRGVGLSRRGGLRRLDVDILDWARLDCDAVTTALAERLGAAPLYWIGHSLGGQILPFVPGHERIAKMVTIASGSGYWRENALPLRRFAWWLWYVVAPVATALCGYFPGRRLRKVGDLPAGVMWQWRRWCLDPDYAAGAEGPGARRAYAALALPIVSLSFSDDEFMSARNTEALHACYAGAARRMKRLSPAEVGMKRIGHFGFFRRDCQDPLWRDHLLPELA
ncbi:alpha/beta hydrolase [Aliidongia dinghuensis]|uniref:Alpha/beta hydrolase n=1 Tax=Aliidongia dinghuensis TaxID=1867774 RepID=A0A8J2YSF4_9PROT|nr:alpha/beta fold hydrolase [Aliidongia dinghuensis]GGF14231.1 alpha/beta hydrolase [Aliidongia dinghuensis]